MGEVDGQFHFCRATWGHLSLAELMSCQCRRGCGCGQGCGCRPGCGCSWGCGCGRGCGCSQRRAGRGTDGSPPPSCPPAGASHKLVPGSAWRSRVRGPAVGNGLGGRGHLLSRGDTDAIASPPPHPGSCLSQDLHSKVASFIQSCLLLRDFLDLGKCHPEPSDIRPLLCSRWESEVSRKRGHRDRQPWLRGSRGPRLMSPVTGALIPSPP